MEEKGSARTTRARFSAVREVLAWWEDEDGYWLVYKDDGEESVPLSVVWKDLYEGKSRSGPGGKGKGKEKENAPAASFCDECFCLLAVAETMRVSTEDMQKRWCTWV
jgi:hypothetical protein